MTREICKCCGEINRVGFTIPDDVWLRSVPLRWTNDVLCIACFTRFADESSVQWDGDISFHPVSFISARE